MYQVVINVSFLEDFTYVLNGWPQPLIFNTVFLKKSLKGGLSGRMTLQFFKCFRVIFSLKMKLSNFRFQSIFISNKKEPQSCQFATYKQNALFEFLTSQTWLLQFSKLLSGSYVSL